MTETSGDSNRITSKDIWLIIIGTAVSGIAGLFAKAMQNDTFFIVVAFLIGLVWFGAPIYLWGIGKRTLAVWIGISYIVIVFGGILIGPYVFS